MALNVYSDAGTTIEVLPNEVFIPGSGVGFCDGSNLLFPMTTLQGADVSNVYVETLVVSSASETFASGVSSTLSSVAGISVGDRVIHNGEFRGTVAVVGASTITLSDLTYTETTPSVCEVRHFTKQTLTLHYSIVGVTVTFVTAPAATSYVHVVPTSGAGLAFGGTPGDDITVTGAVWLKRDPAFEYRSLKVYSQDNSVTDELLTQAGVTSTGTPGVMSGFSGLTTNALVGHAVWHNAGFRGVVASNDASTVTLDRAYTQASAYEAQIFNIGPMLVSITSAVAGFDYVVAPADITTDTAVQVWYKDTIKIPTAPTNYPNIIIKVTGTEYLAA